LSRAGVKDLLTGEFSAYLYGEHSNLKTICKNKTNFPAGGCEKKDNFAEK
jgi:hypothetical protein